MCRFESRREGLDPLQKSVGLRTNQVGFRRGERGFSLAEVVIAMGILALVFAGIIRGNIQAAKRAEWSGYSLAATALSVQQLERCRSALWDNGVFPAVNQLATLTNLVNWQTYTPPANGASYVVGRGYYWADLDLPISGTNWVRATNYVTVSMVNLNNSTNPPVKVQMVQVDTVWPFQYFGGLQYFTNTAATYVSPDDRSPGTF